MYFKSMSLGQIERLLWYCHEYIHQVCCCSNAYCCLWIWWNLFGVVLFRFQFDELLHTHVCMADWEVRSNALYFKSMESWSQHKVRQFRYERITSLPYFQTSMRSAKSSLSPYFYHLIEPHLLQIKMFYVHSFFHIVSQLIQFLWIFLVAVIWSSQHSWMYY